MPNPNHAARLNEEGASFHERGDDTSAFAAFKDALESISADSLANTGASVSAVLSPIPDPTANATNNSGSNTPRLPLVPSNPRTDQPVTNGDDETYLYDRCLVFESEYASDPEAAPYCSAIVVFNMALVYQKRGNDEKTLYKALFLYMVSLRHIRSSESERFKNSDLVIAALNNQAIVFYMLKDYGKARTILGELWSVMRDIRCRPASFQKRDIDGIVQNILLMLHSPSLAAAA